MYFFLERYKESYEKELACFVKALETNNNSFLVTHIDGKKALELAEAAHKSFQEGKSITIGVT
jgi:myo-inositol 2-dehydrogenase/D-chiro-inositol 1-dehydrogenase